MLLRSRSVLPTSYRVSETALRVGDCGCTRSGHHIQPDVASFAMYCIYISRYAEHPTGPTPVVQNGKGREDHVKSCYRGSARSSETPARLVVVRALLFAHTTTYHGGSSMTARRVVSAAGASRATFQCHRTMRLCDLTISAREPEVGATLHIYHTRPPKSLKLGGTRVFIFGHVGLHRSLSRWSFWKDVSGFSHDWSRLHGG
jgi:hypothetical protein